MGPSGAGKTCLIDLLTLESKGQNLHLNMISNLPLSPTMNINPHPSNLHPKPLTLYPNPFTLNHKP